METTDIVGAAIVIFAIGAGLGFYAARLFFSI
jgi:hypothetical protein